VGANYALLTSGSQSVVNDADQVRDFTQEIRYASPKWAQGDFIAGIYYLDEYGTRQLATKGLAAKIGTLASSTLANQQVQTTSYALFADGTLHLPQTVDLTAGVRYTYDKKEAGLVRNDFVKPANDFTLNSLTASWRQLTPRLALSWKPSADAMLYASATRGFTAGGFNTEASSVRAFSTPFEPETVTNFELGLKSQWFNNRLRFNTSVFKMKYKDKQELVNNTVTGILNINNASKATINGAELEVAYKATSWLGFSFNYGKLDAVYDSFVIGTINNTGNPLGSSPANKYSLASDWNYPLASGSKLIGSASYAWTDEYYTGATKDPNLLIAGYGLTNASIGYESADRKFRVMGWIKNISDTAYILTRSTQVVRAEYLGMPRTFGVTMDMKF